MDLTDGPCLVDAAALTTTVCSTKPQHQPHSLQIHRPITAHNQLLHRPITAQSRPGPQELQDKLDQTRTQSLGEPIQTKVVLETIPTDLIKSLPVVSDQPISETTGVLVTVSEDPPTPEEDVSVIIKNQY